MESDKQLKTAKLLWRLLPFGMTACVLAIILKVEWTNDPTTNSGLLIFVPVVAVICFPFFTVLSHIIQGTIRAKQLHISQSQYTSDGRLKPFNEKAGKWVNITIATWVIGFLSFISIPITLSVIDRSDRGTRVVNEGQPQVLSAGSNTHELLSFLDTTMRCLFLIPIIALVLGAVLLIKSLLGKWWKSDRKVPTGWKIFGYASIVAFVLPIIIIFILSFTMERIVRHEVKTWLENVSDDPIVSINNAVIRKPQTVIDELRKLAPRAAHHSRVTKRIRITIIDNDQGLVIDLGRDSQRPQEYWVFYLGYRHTRVNEIGRITTSLFDDYM